MFEFVLTHVPDYFSRSGVYAWVRVPPRHEAPLSGVAGSDHPTTGRLTVRILATEWKPRERGSKRIGCDRQHSQLLLTDVRKKRIIKKKNLADIQESGYTLFPWDAFLVSAEGGSDVSDYRKRSNSYAQHY